MHGEGGVASVTGGSWLHYNWTDDRTRGLSVLCVYAVYYVKFVGNRASYVYYGV